MIHRLVKGTASKKELAEPFEMGLPSFKKHIKVLEESGLIDSEKRGRVRTCYLKDKRLAAVESWLSKQRALLDLTLSRVIKAPRSAVWKAWTMPEHLEQWWAPAPVKTKVIALDVTPGGSFHTEMTMPDGAKHPGHGCFLEVIPEQRIVFTDALSGGVATGQGTLHDRYH